MPQLQEFGSRYEPETLRNSKKTDIADVIIYVYDSSDTNSFSYISNLRVCYVHIVVCSLTHITTKQQYSLDHIPTLFVATKSDLDLAMQVRHINPFTDKVILKISRTSDTRCSLMYIAGD